MIINFIYCLLAFILILVGIEITGVSNNGAIVAPTRPGIVESFNGGANQSDEIGKDVSLGVAREFARWRALYSYYLKATEGIKDRKKYEIKNILERYVISSANVLQSAKSSTDARYEHVICVDNDSVERMKFEARENNLNMNVDEFVADIQKYLQTSTYPSVNVTVDIGPAKVEIAVMGSINTSINTSINMSINTSINTSVYKYTLTRRRYDALIKRLHTHSETLNDQLAQNHIAKMLLRYECMYPGGQQWGSSEADYTMLHDHYNVRLEGFASPKNSQLLYHADSYFCSLFYDTDHVFGSRGSFFACDFVEFARQYPDLPYVGFLVGPPYIAHLMLDCMKKLLDEVEKMKRVNIRALVIFSCPAWRDAEYFILGEASPYKQFSKRLEADQHAYVDTSRIDPMTGEPPKVIAHFPSHLFGFTTGNFAPINFDKFGAEYHQIY
jgi:hypothetical protein